MTNSSIEIYNALLEAGVPKNKAEEAAKSVISKDEALNTLASKQDVLRLKSELITWMVGLQIASVALLVSVLQ